MNSLLSFDSNSQIVVNDDNDCRDGGGDGFDSSWEIIDNNSNNSNKLNEKQKCDFTSSTDSQSQAATKKQKSWKLIKKKYYNLHRRRKNKQHSKHSAASQPDDQMVGFFQTVHSIQNYVDAISTNTQKILEMKDEVMQATSSAEEEKISQKLHAIANETKQIATKAKKLISLLKEESEHLKKKKLIRSSDLRVRENLHNAIVRKFVEATNKCRDAEEQFKNNLKRKISRQIHIMMPDANDDDIEVIMKSGKNEKDAFTQQMILGNVASDVIQSMYHSVSNKYQDILSLEENINELYQMYLDFAILTEQQGEVLDHIEYQVKIVNEDIKESNDGIHKAIKYQKRIRKKQCMLIGIIVVIVIVIAVVMLA